MIQGFDAAPGATIPGTPYSIVRSLGSGGMGDVFEVEDRTVGRRFVMKTLRRELCNREDFAARLEHEARTLGRLDHPNVVQVVTAGVTGDDARVPFFVMERLEGQTLRALIERRGALPLHATLTIAIELLDALDRAHEEGILHRDVKPENVFVHRPGDGSATTKLLDFGIGTLLEQDGGVAGGAGESPGAGACFVGTVRYAAPEQARGERVTTQTDLYAAGLVLYEMIAGRGPFDDVSGTAAVLAAHANTAPPPLSLFTDVPEALEALVASALAKDPADRPRDAHAFAAALRDVKHGLRVSEPRAEPVGPATAPANGTRTTVVMAVALAAAAATIWMVR